MKRDKTSDEQMEKKIEKLVGIKMQLCVTMTNNSSQERQTEASHCKMRIVKQTMIQGTQYQRVPNLTPNVLPKSMEKDHTMLSPDSHSKNKSLKPQMASDDQAVSTNINQAFLFFFCAEQPTKQDECHTNTIQQDEPQTRNPKWSPLNLRILDQSLQVE